MHLSNGIKVYCKSMGKIFRVSHIAKTVEEANKFTENHADTGVIAEDKNGLIYIAEFYQIKINSNILPD